ncbi:MAG TPA: MAC/perforin domain-containing protein [Dehalococcoidia bacterium]|nr:MAC/perforin domain-containing protein [Dehalococcoidia bacterium]
MSDATELNGLEFLGKCYDLLSLDPLNLGGLAKTVNAIDVARAGGGSYEQGSYVVPNGVSLQSPFNTEAKTFRSLVQNSYDFQNEFSSTLELNAGIEGCFEFSTSNSFKEITQASQSRKQVSTYAIVYVQNHVVALDLDGPDEKRISTAFAHAVKGLPGGMGAQAEQRAYSEFIRKFGTHFTRRVSLGGMAYSRVSGLTTKVLASREREDEFTAKAKLEMDIFKSGASLSETRKQLQKSDEENEIERGIVVFRGGIGSMHEIADEWFSGLQERPAPIPAGTELARLSELLTADFFPNDPAIAGKRRSLDEAVDQYIISSGGALDGTIRYGDKVVLYNAPYERGKPLDYQLKLNNTNPNGSAVYMAKVDRSTPNPVATMTVVDPQGRWGAAGQQPHEVMAARETQIGLRVEGGNGSGQRYLSTKPFDSAAQTAIAAFSPNPNDPQCLWSLCVAGEVAGNGTRIARPLVSGDWVSITREDAPARAFLTLNGQPVTPGEQPGLRAVMTGNPWFDHSDGNARRFVIQKVK